MTQHLDGPLVDGCGRPIRYLRVSVTDRCNLRCRYCCPSIQFSPLSHVDMISYEEVTRLAHLLAPKGVSSIRITGGEPLVRKNLDRLIRCLSQVPGIEDIALTTNGLLLEETAESLAKAGLSRINVSLDSLIPERFAWITRLESLNGSDGPKAVLKGIEAGRAAGLDPIKINVVLMRGINDDELPQFAELTRDQDCEVRFIEFMPLCPEVFWGVKLMIPSSEIIQRIEESCGPLAAVGRGKGVGPAVRYRISGHRGTIGLISPISNHFCAHCNRIRLTADGKILPCLFSNTETDLLAPMRSGKRDGEILSIIEDTLRHKPSGHGIAESWVYRACTRTMSHIGG